MDFWRQLDIVSPEDLASLRVTVIGVGGIGSPTTLALAKMGIRKIIVYDDDKVESHNLPNQFYKKTDLGVLKVCALANLVDEFANATIEARAERFDGSQELSGVVVSGVDTMEARKLIWTAVKFNPSVQLYIEGRMGAEIARINTVSPTDPKCVKWYESTLYTDEEAVEALCTARAIIYCSLMTAALVANQVKKFAHADPLAREIIVDLLTLSLIVNY